MRKPKLPKLKKRSIADFGLDNPDSDKKISRVSASAEDVRAISIAAAKSNASSDQVAADVGSLATELASTDLPTEMLAQVSGDVYSLLAKSFDTSDLSIDVDALPDPVAMIERAIAADLDPSIFTERNFPVAENIVDWCRNPDFLGYNGELFPRQVQVLAHFFCDLCYFCSDTAYVHDVPVKDSIGNVLDRFVLLQHGVCPKCRRNRTEILRDWHLDARFWEYSNLDSDVKVQPVPYNEFVGLWGQRSSKSYIVATFAVPYILHRYLVLPSPTRYFGLPSNDVFEITFVAPTLHQASKYTWSRFREAYESSPWFKSIREYFKGESKRIGVQFYHSGATFIAFPSKRLAIHMLASNSSTLRGGNRLVGTIDELGHFNYNEENQKRSGVKDGMEVYAAISNSMLTLGSKATYRREVLGDYNTLDAYMFNISSPSAIGDPIMQLAALAPRSPRMYFTHFYTWNVNPNESEEVLRQKPRDVFLRDFCAIPPRAVSPFIQDSKSVYDLTYQDNTHLFNYSVEDHVGDDGATRLRPILSDIKQDKLSPRILTIDNGEVCNSFALCIARYENGTDELVYEEFIEVAPYRGHSVDLAWCYDNLIITLLQRFHFLHVCFDRWNSAYAINDLRANRAVDAQIYTLRWADFDAYRESIRGMRMKFPIPEVNPDELLAMRDITQRARFPRAHYLLQTTTVSQFGRSVPLKPDNDSDDLFRVAVLAHRFVTKYKEDYKKYSSYALRHQLFTRHSVGTFRGASSGEWRGEGAAERTATTSGGHVVGLAKSAAAARGAFGRGSAGRGRRAVGGKK